VTPIRKYGHPGDTELCLFAWHRFKTLYVAPIRNTRLWVIGSISVRRIGIRVARVSPTTVCLFLYEPFISFNFVSECIDFYDDLIDTEQGHRPVQMVHSSWASSLSSKATWVTVGRFRGSRVARCLRLDKKQRNGGKTMRKSI